MHFVAVSTNRTAVVEFGIDPTYMFEFWDWVGGRYSMWSAIGLSLMIAIGPERFARLLAGAHEMDEHFRTAPWAENLPVRMALLSHWYRNFLDCQTHAVVPYAHVLGQVPVVPPAARDGESTASRSTSTGAPVGVDTSAIVWGTRRHQRPARVLPDAAPRHHDRAHRLHRLPPPAARVFAFPITSGCSTRTSSRRPKRSRSAPTTRTSSRTACMPGNRPSTVFLADHLDPHALGALIAAYEHKVLTLGHDLGDRRLRPVGRRARQGARGHDRRGAGDRCAALA